MRAPFDFDGDVAQALQTLQPLLVDRRLQRGFRHERDHGRAVTGANLPHMQIGDAVLTGFQTRTDGALQATVGADVKQRIRRYAFAPSARREARLLPPRTT